MSNCLEVLILVVESRAQTITLHLSPLCVKLVVFRFYVRDFRASKSEFDYSFKNLRFVCGFLSSLARSLQPFYGSLRRSVHVSNGQAVYWVQIRKLEVKAEERGFDRNRDLLKILF